VFEQRYTVCVQRTTGGKKAATEARANGVTPIRESEHDAALEMSARVMGAAQERAADGDTDLADILAAEGLREQSFIWTDPVTGVHLTGRADKMIPAVPMIADLKTAKHWRDDNHEWIRHAWRYGYHRQAWLYCSGFEQVFGAWPRYVLIVVHNSPPFEVAVYEYMRDGSEMGLGELECRRAMRMVLDCKESGKWYAPEERGTRPLIYPEHFYPQIELVGVEES
jgi:hypothetical protein